MAAPFFLRLGYARDPARASRSRMEQEHAGQARIDSGRLGARPLLRLPGRRCGCGRGGIEGPDRHARRQAATRHARRAGIEGRDRWPAGQAWNEHARRPQMGWRRPHGCPPRRRRGGRRHQQCTDRNRAAASKGGAHRVGLYRDPPHHGTGQVGRHGLRLSRGIDPACGRRRRNQARSEGRDGKRARRRAIRPCPGDQPGVCWRADRRQEDRRLAQIRAAVAVLEDDRQHRRQLERAGRFCAEGDRVLCCPGTGRRRGRPHRLYRPVRGARSRGAQPAARPARRAAPARRQRPRGPARRAARPAANDPVAVQPGEGRADGRGGGCALADRRTLCRASQGKHGQRADRPVGRDRRAAHRARG